MTKLEVIEYIGKNRIIEDIIRNVAGTSDDDLKDLAQDIYLDLFTKSEELLTTLAETNSLNYYITRIVFNNVFSKNSRFYTRYKKNNKNKINLDEIDFDKY